MSPLTTLDAVIAFTITIGQILSKNDDTILASYGQSLVDACIPAARAIPCKTDRSRVRQVRREYFRIVEIGWVDGKYNAEATLSFLLAAIDDSMAATNNTRLKTALDEVVNWLNVVMDFFDPDREGMMDFELAMEKYRRFAA